MARSSPNPISPADRLAQPVPDEPFPHDLIIDIRTRLFTHVLARGTRLAVLNAAAAILVRPLLTVWLVITIKIAHDYVKEHNARIIDRYMEIVGRLSALLIGTIAVKRSLRGWGPGSGIPPQCGSKGRAGAQSLTAD